jgi:hypothetical protein
MKNLIAILLLYILMPACSDCNRVDCIEGEEFRFNFISTQSNENLVFGLNPTINRSEIKVFSMESGGIKHEKLNFHSTGFIYFTPHFSQSEYFVEAGGKIDTLLFNFSRSGNNRCCGPINLITQIRINNMIQTNDTTFYFKFFR